MPEIMISNIQSSTKDRAATNMSYATAGRTSPNLNDVTTAAAALDNSSSVDPPKKKRAYRARGCRGGASRKGKQRKAKAAAEKHDGHPIESTESIESQENVDPSRGDPAPEAFAIQVLAHAKTSNNDENENENENGVEKEGAASVDNPADGKQPHQLSSGKTLSTLYNIQNLPRKEILQPSASASCNYSYNGDAPPAPSFTNNLNKPVDNMPIQSQAAVSLPSKNAPLDQRKRVPPSTAISARGLSNGRFNVNGSSATLFGNTGSDLSNDGAQHLHREPAEAACTLELGASVAQTYTEMKLGYRTMAPPAIAATAAAAPPGLSSKGVGATPGRAVGPPSRVRPREDRGDEEWSFFSVSPRSFLNGQRKTKLQRTGDGPSFNNA